MNKLLLIIVFVSSCWTAWSADGAELRLKQQARCSTSVLRLGDVADVFAAEAWQVEQLTAIELGPAPATGTKKFVRAREVQDALWMRGVNLAEHRLSGVDRVEVIGPGNPVATPEKPLPRLDDSSRERALKQVNDAVARCLQKQAGGNHPWQVKVSLSDEQAAKIVAAAGRISAEGGMTPWIGLQSFVVRDEETGAKVQFSVDAEVSLPPAVVALARNVTLGTILHAGDLELKPVAAVSSGLQPFYRIEEVVGQEMTWGAPAGTILGRTSIRRPVVVRRGEAVTLYARSAGLRVRTTVRSREDGGVGDLIAVESFGSREPFYARVTGIQEAEVYAVPAEASAPAATTSNRFDALSTQGGTVR